MGKFQEGEINGSFFRRIRGKRVSVALAGMELCVCVCVWEREREREREFIGYEMLVWFLGD